MKKFGPDEVKNKIINHADIVNFGSSADAVDEEWLLKAEAILKKPLTDSYKWFLKTYAGGEIGGEEIYSLYGMPFENINGGDIVFQYLANKKSNLLDESKVVISETDLGEVFFFDYNYFSENECPIYLRLPSGNFIKYSENFYEFLCQRIDAHA